MGAKASLRLALVTVSTTILAAAAPVVALAAQGNPGGV